MVFLGMDLLKGGQSLPITGDHAAGLRQVMFPIPPNKRPIVAPEQSHSVAPVEHIPERSVPKVTASPSEGERRGRQERRQENRPRIKGYEMRSGRDRRKSARSSPIIDLDV